MITCPSCSSTTEGIEVMPTNDGYYLAYCPECGWVAEEDLLLPLIELDYEIEERVRLRESKE